MWRGLGGVYEQHHLLLCDSVAEDIIEDNNTNDDIKYLHRDAVWIWTALAELKVPGMKSSCSAEFPWKTAITEAWEPEVDVIVIYRSMEVFEVDEVNPRAHKVSEDPW